MQCRARSLKETPTWLFRTVGTVRSTMGARGKEEHEARNTGVPQAWVWSQYRGESGPFEGECGSAAEEDPILFEEKGIHPFATALGLAATVAIIMVSVWLFTPQVPSSLTIGSTSKKNDLEYLSVLGENSSEKVAASSPKSEAAATADPKSVAAPDFETKLRSFLEHGPGKEASFDLGRVAFDLGGATLTATAHEELQRLAGILMEYPGTHTVIGVHSDVGGSASEIVRLSAQRAKTVQRELMRLGIGHSFVAVAGEGRASLRASTTARPGCVWIYVKKK
jgi:outer membrane protein OmpA-like peptidoglycan-associated protein